jgi:hypothetical protein
MYHDFISDSVPPDLLPLVTSAVSDIEKAIRNGPVKYAGGSIEGHESYFSYERVSRRRRRYESSGAVVDTLGSVLVLAGTWREMCLIGHWISESLVIRWAAELTNELSNQAVSIAEVVGLLLSLPETERDV